MTSAMATILALAAISYGLKAAGPLVLGGRQMPPALARLAEVVPGPLLAALVLTSAVVEGTGFRFDARLVGLAVAALALRLRAGFVFVVVVAAAATTLARLVGL